MTSSISPSTSQGLPIPCPMNPQATNIPFTIVYNVVFSAHYPAPSSFAVNVANLSPKSTIAIVVVAAIVLILFLLGLVIYMKWGRTLLGFVRCGSITSSTPPPAYIEANQVTPFTTFLELSPSPSVSEPKTNPSSISPHCSINSTEAHASFRTTSFDPTSSKTSSPRPPTYCSLPGMSTDPSAFAKYHIDKHGGLDVPLPSKSRGPTLSSTHSSY